jgi:hypothetical protein
MELNSSYKKFENLLERIFRGFEFNVKTGETINQSGKRYEVDLVLNRNQATTFVEVKFYRSKGVNGGLIRDAGKQLKPTMLSQESSVNGLLIISAYAPDDLKYEMVTQDGISLWDRNDLYNLIKYGLRDSQLLEDFEQLLNEAKQGVDTEDVFADAAIVDKVPGDYFKALQFHLTPPPVVPPSPRKRDWCRDLGAVMPGKPGWSSYEKIGVEVLKYLFEKDLANWNTQQRTDDELSRFDMICRVISKNDFWKNLIQSFQSRYVLFEFKNYSDPIGQDQIYTTERYLYLRGLRSVGFIVAPKGGSSNAQKAAKGALREHGKVILILNNDDLCKMVDMKEKGGEPSDYLSDKLDDFLISLSR